MQFLSIFNKYKVLAAQYLGDAMGHFPFRYTFIFVVRYQFQFAINLRHQCRLVPALLLTCRNIEPFDFAPVGPLTHRTNGHRANEPSPSSE